MAIIKPNTRNAFGVPARYSDLASAGLRWTPPTVYRYDAYDVQGDEATLYAEDIDLADYQYNTDSYNAAVVPEGYAGVTGGTAKWLIGTDTKLYYRDAGLIALPDNSPSGVSRIATKGYEACWAIVNGALCGYAMSSSGDLYGGIIDSTRVWTEISFVMSPSGAANYYAIGIADGKLAGVNDYDELPVKILSHATGWKISGGVMQYMPGYSTAMFMSTLVIDGSGYLHHVRAGDNSAALGNVLELGDGWQVVSGYMSSSVFSPTYGGIETRTERMYGVQAGKLYSLTNQGDHYGPSDPYKTQITEFTDWWRVTFVAPDEAVAIRRIAI